MDTIRGLIFDYGGTLDTGGDHWSEVMATAYRATGIHVDREIFRRAYVYAERTASAEGIIMAQDDFHATLLKKIRLQSEYLPSEIVEGVSAEQIADICDTMARMHITAAREVIETLHERHSIALVSNFYGNLQSVLRGFGIERLFDIVIESAATGIRKPDTRIFSMAIDKMGLSAGEVLVTGDSIKNDIIPADSIGCRTVWLRGAQWEETLPSLPPSTVCISSLPQLLGIPGI